MREGARQGWAHSCQRCHGGSPREGATPESVWACGLLQAVVAAVGCGLWLGTALTATPLLSRAARTQAQDAARL